MSYYSLEKRKVFLQEQSDRQPLPPFQANARINAPELYQPSPELADAVNVALRLGLPLLLTGEPGSGKTQLADHLAWFFDLGETLVFNAQTTSTASDLFYQYDALGHFQYSQNSREPLSNIWYRRWTPVVVSSVTPRIAAPSFAYQPGRSLFVFRIAA